MTIPMKQQILKQERKVFKMSRCVSIICYGVLFEEDFEFPWNTEKHLHSLKLWYLEQNGISEGGNFDLEKIKAEYTKFELQQINCIEEVNYSSKKEPMIILAISSTTKSSLIGDPTEFNPIDMVYDEIDKSFLISLCERIGNKNQPKWYLCSYRS